MNRQYFKWFSPILQKDIELLCFGYAGTPVLFFPTRTARFYDYENWRIIEALGPKIEAGQLQVFCIDSIDVESFYSNKHPAQRIARHLQYEAYVLNEVLPFIKRHNTNKQLTVAGCSLGGYHAVNLAFRHPHLFAKVVGLSARYDLTLYSDKFPDLLSGYIDEDVYYNMPSFGNNNHLAEALRQKQIEPEFYVWEEEAHRPRYWRQMVQLYL